MSDIYSAPAATLTETAAAPSGYGSLERGIAGDYQFSIGETLSEAWAKTPGAKGALSGASLIYGVTVVVMTIISGFIETASGNSILVTIALQLLATAIQTPLLAGLYILGLRRSVGAPIQAGLITRYFANLLPIFVMTILMYLLMTIGFVLLIIPGLYLSIAYALALPLLVEKNLGIWEALEASRKAISKRWFAIFGFFIVVSLLNVVAAIPLLIGLIWSVPMSLIATGILYRNIFGIEAATLND